MGICLCHQRTVMICLCLICLCHQRTVMICLCHQRTLLKHKKSYKKLRNKKQKIKLKLQLKTKKQKTLLKHKKLRNKKQKNKKQKNKKPQIKQRTKLKTKEKTKLKHKKPYKKLRNKKQKNKKPQIKQRTKQENGEHKNKQPQIKQLLDLAYGHRDRMPKKRTKLRNKHQKKKGTQKPNIPTLPGMRKWKTNGKEKTNKKPQIKQRTKKCLRTHSRRMDLDD